MGREQIIKDFSELCIGQNPRQLTEDYYQKKKKEVFLLIVAAIFIVAACAMNDLKSSRVESNRILRKEADGGKEELLLQMKTEDGKWQDILFTLYPKEYSADELELLFLKACDILPTLIQKENESLDYVHSDLNLVQEMEGFPFLLRWESANPEVIDNEGNLLYGEESSDRMVELTATFTYGEWEQEFKLSVYIPVQPIKDFKISLEDNLKEQELLTRDQEEFYLPDIFMENSLQWRYSPGNSAIVLGILFFIMLPLISYQKDQEIHNQTKKRKEQLQESFPEFISKLILLMEAGMSIRIAFFRIAEDYQRNQHKKKNYLYEELMYICRQMKNGLSEKEAYELLGKRCNLSCYKKLSGLLIQHLQKGGSSILKTLRKESVKASEEQKRQTQKKGEEMGTKLLFPMVIMLGIVMVFIMVPALFSFQM